MVRTVLPSAPRMTASINVRLSKEAREENLSKDGMLNDCRAICERMGLRIVGEHIDDGISGAIRNRPGFVAWLNDARHLRADHLIAWHVDRMTREGVNVAGTILDAIEGKDPETGRVVYQPVRLLDAQGLDSGSGDDTAFRFNFVIKAEVARAERERMKERMRSANRRAKIAGRWAGGPTPYGFQVIDNPDGAGKVVTPEEREAAFIREAAERVLAGQPITAVTRWANRQTTMRPRKAEHWGRKSLAAVLTGFAVQGKVMVRVEDGWVAVIDERGNPVTHEAILDPDTSAAVRQALSVKDPNPLKGGRGPSRILSGVLRCASCSGKMTVSQRRSPYPHTGYRCADGYADGICPRPVTVTAHLIEAFIESAFLMAHGDQPEMVKRAHVAGAALVDEAEERHAAALQAISVAPTPENLATLQEAMAHLAEARELPHETTLTFVPTGRTIAEAWHAGGIDDRRELLSTNYVEVRVHPGSRGKRSIEPERIDIVAQPLYVAGASLEEDYSPGMLVLLDDED